MEQKRNPAALPNLVFILSDDHGAWALGKETPEILTPNLDRMIREGVWFRNFFCASPVCSPARMSLVTGRLPSAHGVHDWLSSGNADAEKLPPDMRAAFPRENTACDFLSGMPECFSLLRGAGYRMALIGKWHMGDSLRPRPGFDTWIPLLRGGCRYMHADVCVDGAPRFLNQYVTDFFSDRAAEYLESRPHGPFLLCLHYTAPHTPWNHEEHRQDILRRYDGCAFRCHPFRPVHPDQVEMEVGDTDERRRYLLKGYYAAITAMDEGIGRVLEALEKTGLAENTAVFFSGDNGMNLGQHGIWGKGNGTWPMNMYDTSVRVPFIAWGAGIRRGARVENLYSHVDVLPTLCDALGAPLPGVLPGESFLEELTKGRAPRDRQICILDEYGPVRMIRTRTHKYIHEGIRGGHQLYDLTSDPGEEHNLFGHPAYAAVQEQLRQRLEEAFARFTRAPFDGAKTSPDGSGQNAPITYAGEDVFEHTTRLFRGPRDPGRQTAANAGSRAIRTETSKKSHEPNGSV